MKQLILFVVCFMPISFLQAYNTKASVELKALLNNAVKADRELVLKNEDTHAKSIRQAFENQENKRFLSIVCGLIENGANPNIPNDLNSSCVVHFAIQYGDIDLIRYYLETGGRLEPYTIDSCYLPLEMAIYSFETEIIEFLISYGANIHMEKRRSIIDLAAMHLDEEAQIFEKIKKYACRGSQQIKYFPIERADGPVDKITASLQAGDDKELCKQIRKISYNGQNAIHTAVSICWNPQLNVRINLLPTIFSYYKKINKLGELINAQDDEGRTPLMLALIMRNKASIFLLLKNGAKVLWPPKGPNLVYLAHVVPEFQIPGLLDEKSVADCIYKEATFEFYLMLMLATKKHLPDELIPREVIFEIASLVPQIRKLKPFNFQPKSGLI